MNERSLSERAACVEPFLVMEVLERAQALEREGRSIVHLEVGEPDFPTPPAAARAAEEAIAAGDTRYTHSLGIVEVREAIAERMARVYGVELATDRILVTAGSSLAMLYTFGALLEPGDEVIAATPHYPCYPNFVRFFGGRFVPAPTSPADGYALDPEEVRKRLTPRTRALLVNSPANPTGAVLDAARWRALAEMQVPIVSDEVYHGLTYGDAAPTALSFAPDAFVVDGCSKRYAMTGWRIGWAIAPARWVRAMQKLQQSFLISASAVAQRAAVAAIRWCEPDAEAMRRVFARRRALAVDLFRSVGFGIAAEPAGAFYVFADVSRWTKDSLAFAFELLECAGVAVAPGIDFGEAGRRCVRLSYCASEDALREAAQRVGNYLSGCRSAPR